MMKRLLGLLIPASILAAGVAASAYAAKLGFIKPAIWVYLWPSLVALLFLALGITCIFMRLRTWLWPLGTGFLVQVVGILMMAAGSLDTPWEVLEVTLIAVGIVLFVMLVVWLVVTLRARWLERKMLEGMGGEGGIDQQELQKIRNSMQEALALLRRAGGRNAIYELPWSLFIGRAKAGKTVAIQNSGLSLPVRKDRVKGIGGTHTLDFFFTPEVIFLDTPGEWTSKVIDEDGRRVWLESLRLLRKYRGRRPLDGIVVVVPADDLLSKTDEELQDQAGNVREVIDLMQGELKFRFPVYLLVSKTDLVDGFVDFFRGLPPQRRHEILGWSSEDPNAPNPLRLISQGFKRVVRRLEDYRLEMLARVGKKRHARGLFFFTENFRRLERPLSIFADILFLEDPAHQPPVFRGFYFTSGTQGEGSPMGEALTQLARNLGVRVGQPQQAGEEEPKRAYFLLELFRTLMVGDEGLVSRTALHWWRRRRDTIFVAFLPAGLAVLTLGMTLLSYALNTGVYREAREEVPRIVSKLAEYRRDARSMGLNQALEYTAQLRDYHKAVDGFTIFKRFGMRRPGHLPSQTFEIFRKEFTESIFDPTLVKAQEFALDSDQSCADRMDVFYSIIWLRQGQRGEWSDDLQGLATIWGLPDKEATAAREEVLDQFRYLKDHASENATYLTPISLEKMARAIGQECSEGGSLSALDQYVKFQSACGDPPSPCEISDCRDKLVRATQFQEKTFDRMRDHIEKLRDYLRALGRTEPGTDAALAAFGDVGVKESKAGECQTRFEQETLAAISKYADQKDLIDDCNAQWKGGGEKARVAFDVLRGQAKELAEKEKEIRKVLSDFNRDCSSRLQGVLRLSPEVLIGVVNSYRRVACMEQDVACEAGREAAPPRPVRPVGGAAPAPAPPSAAASGEAPERPRPRPAGFSWVDAPKSPGFTSDSWSRRKSRWSEDLGIARDELSGSEKQAELDRIREEVEGYSQQYVMAWQDYLDQLDLRPNRGSVPLWIEGLSGTAEYRTALLPAALALQVGDRETDPPFDAMRMRLQGLAGIAPFVDGGLGQYQRMLGRVAADLKKCEADHGFWADYSAQVSNENAANSLVQAMQWIEANAGVGLAQGRLRRLLTRPLDEARHYVKSSGDLTATQWKGLRDLFGQVEGRFPFAGDDKARLVDEQDLRALFGGKSGYARVFAEASRSLPMSAEARGWVDDAAVLSRIFFPDGQDEPQPLSLKIEVGEVTVDPADKLKDQYRVDELLIYLGGGLDFKWKPGEAKMKRIDVPLFGKDASEESVVKMTVSERKGAMGRAFSSENFKEGEPQDIAPSRGPWAPLRVIEAGLPQGGEAPTSDRLSLSYSAQVPYKKGNPGKITVVVTVDGKGLARLLALMKSGLTPPPAALGGSP